MFSKAYQILIKSRVSSVVLFFVLCIFFSACNPAAGVVQRTALPDDASDPTSIVVTYRTPRPTPIQTSAAPAATLTPTLDFDPDYYNGGLTVTLDYVGQTVSLHTGQSFLLALGNEYTWSVEISPTEVVSLNMKITPEPGEQGVYVAREKGKAALKAVGVPTCRSDQPACSRPDILFQMAILVQ